MDFMNIEDGVVGEPTIIGVDTQKLSAYVIVRLPRNQIFVT